MTSLISLPRVQATFTYRGLKIESQSFDQPNHHNHNHTSSARPSFIADCLCALCLYGVLTSHSDTDRHHYDRFPGGTPDDTSDNDNDLNELPVDQVPSFIPFESILFAQSKITNILAGQNYYKDSSVRPEDEEVEELENELVTVTFARKQGDDVVPRSVSLFINPLTVPIAQSQLQHESNNNINNDIKEVEDDTNIQKQRSSSDSIAESILRKAYEGTTRHRRILILINPNGGKGAALSRFNTSIKPILDAAHIKYDLAKTQYYRHAIDIIKETDFTRKNYDTIACCSGDGIPFEVINGIYQRPDRSEIFAKVAVTQLPCGSGNALSLSCHKTLDASHATLSMLKSPTINMDLMAVQQGTGNDTRTHLSFLSQTYGVIADADIATEWLRKLGPARFELGVAYKVLSSTKYPCELSVKYKAKNLNEVRDYFNENHKKSASESISNNNANNITISEDTFQSKIPSLDQDVPLDWERVANTDTLSIFYTGKMPYISKDVQFFPAALPSDGTMDLVVMNSRTNFFSTALMLTSLDSGKQIFNNNMQYSKIEAYRLTPFKKNYISVDGESFPLEPIQAEVVPLLLKVIAKDGTFHETVLNKVGS